MPDQIADRVRTIVARVTKVRPNLIFPEAQLSELGADNIELMIIALDIEMAFELEIGLITDITRDRWRTVGDISDTLDSLLRKAAA